MPEEFAEISNASKHALVKQIVAIADVLKKELLFDSLSPSWHLEDGIDAVTVGILARLSESHHCITIDTRCVDEPREPREMHPAACCPVGTLQVFSAEASPREVQEVAELRMTGWSMRFLNPPNPNGFISVISGIAMNCVSVIRRDPLRR